MNPSLYQWADMNDFRVKPTAKTTSAPPTSSATSTSRTPPPVVTPFSSPGWSSDPSGDSATGGSGANAGKGGSLADASRVGSMIGTAGSILGSREAGMAGAALNVGAATLDGNYGPLGSLAGGLMTGSPIGAVAGGLAGKAASGKSITGKDIGGALLGAAVPGYGIVNAVTGGFLNNSLMGKDISYDREKNTVSPSVPGLLGNWGKTDFGPEEQGNVNFSGSKNYSNQMDRASDAAAQAAAQQEANNLAAQEDAAGMYGGTDGGGGLGPGENASSAGAVNGSDSMSDGFSGDGPGGW